MAYILIVLYHNFHNLVHLPRMPGVLGKNVAKNHESNEGFHSVLPYDTFHFSLASLHNARYSRTMGLHYEVLGRVNFDYLPNNVYFICQTNSRALGDCG